jgi:hypothetical protein
MKKLLPLLFLLVACGHKPERVYCLDLPEGIVTSRTYYPLGYWGHIEVLATGSNSSTTLNGSHWFDKIDIGDTITHEVTVPIVKQKDTVVLYQTVHYSWCRSNGIWYAHQLGDSMQNGQEVIYDIPMHPVIGLRELPESVVILNKKDTLRMHDTDTYYLKSNSPIRVIYMP